MTPDQDTNWQTHAACAGLDVDLFFPERGASTREAKAVCAGCQRKDECLEYALANNEKFGVWGGLAERQRRIIRGHRAQAGRQLAAECPNGHRYTPENTYYTHAGTRKCRQCRRDGDTRRRADTVDNVIPIRGDQ